jgi:endonuclease YncB( thermonuclease family)
MRQAVRRVFVALVLGLAAGLIVVRYFATTQEMPAAISARDEQRLETARPTPAAGEPAAEPHDRSVRDVTPQGVSRVFMPPPAAGSKRVPTVAAIRISQAGVALNGEIRGEGGTARLYGVAFPDAKRICTTEAGERWACGRRAYIALHNRIAFEEVSCEPRATTEPPQADCHVGDANLAAWLLAEGLAQLAPDVTDKELVAAEAAAKNAKRGLWSDSGAAAAPSAQRP